MSDKKIIAVVGATGAQGGGLARAILDDPNGPFTLRALTRHTDSPRARELAARGAEVVEAARDDEASVRRAFDGAYGAFVVTNFWAQLTPEQEAARSRAQMELDQAEIAARAARATGLKHVVWSTLEDTRPFFAHLGSNPPTLLGKYKVPHLDCKGEANTFFVQHGVPTTFLETTTYYENFVRGWGVKRDPNGELVLTTPLGDSVLALVGAEDIGRTAHGIFLAGVRFISRKVSLAGAFASGDELAALFTKVLGVKVVYRPITIEQMRAAGFPQAQEVATTYEWRTGAAASFIGNRDISLIRQINPRLKSLEEWLTEHENELLPG
jgi:uncharacterized protein YbjT (DUF2867 family)